MTSNLTGGKKSKGKNTPSDAKSNERVCANCGSDTILTVDSTYVFDTGILARFREWECPVCHYFITRYDPPEPPAPPSNPSDFPF